MELDTLARPCRWCGDPILWLRHETSGNLAPIDAAPRGDGNIRVDLGAGTYRIAPRGSGGRLRMNHWATCDSDEARRRRDGRQRGAV